MPLVAGIDEAGYGPLLGPLVAAATLWQVEPGALGTDLWQRLEASVCRKPRRDDPRLPVGDSKQVFDRKRGITTLERTVLAFAHVAGLGCGTLAELLDALSGERPGRGFPWYADLSRRLPVDPARSACEGAALRLRAAMADARVVCTGVRAQVITEDVFNRRVEQTRNKAAVLLEAVLRLVHWATTRCGDQDVYVVVDRLGGRADYRALLMQAFPERHVHVQDVSDTCSRYRLAARNNDWHVEFVIDADQQHLPVALASMVAKYVRELLMERFNAYWCGLRPRLRPTAGYYTDAQRFLADIGPLAKQAGMPLERFVRAR